MDKFEKLVLDTLNSIPIRNNDLLKKYTINSAILERLDKVNNSFNDSESLLLKVLDKPSNNLRFIIKSLNKSNEMIKHSDDTINRLFKQLGGK